MRFSLIETRVINEDIESMKKYYPNIPDEKFMYYIKLDPTYKDGSNNAGNYGKWILGLANKGEIENIGHVTDVLRRFEETKNSLKNKDIMKYKSVDEVEDMLNNDDSYKDLSHRQEVRQRQKDRKNADLGKEAKLVYEDSDWEVWVPESYAASCKLGQGAKWCTASTEDDYYYNYYKNQYGGDYYINISKKDPSVKFQFHFPSGQFMDVEDAPINLAKFMEKYPALKDFYYENEVKSLFHDIDLEAKTPTVEIDKVDIAEKAAGNHRDSLSSDFIHSVLIGMTEEEFWANYDYWSDADKNYFVKSELDIDKWYPRIKEVYTDANGFDDEDEYKDLSKAEQIEYFIENDGNIYDAFGSAYNFASEQGAANEATEDVLMAIKNALPSWVDRENTDIWNGAEGKSIIAVNADWLKKNWAETFSSEYGYDEDAFNGVKGIILQALDDECDIYEPRYGWYGFSMDTFDDELDYRLSELNESLSTDGKHLNEVYPNKGESKKDFISRFMSATKDEYPDNKQRYAVALSYWNRRNKKNESVESSDIEKVREYLLSLNYSDLTKMSEEEDIEKNIGNFEITVWAYPSHFGSAWRSKPVVAIQIDREDRPNGFAGTQDIESEDEYKREVEQLVRFIKNKLDADGDNKKNEDYQSDDDWKYHPSKLIERRSIGWDISAFLSYAYRGNVYEPNAEHSGKFILEYEDDRDVRDVMPTTTPNEQPVRHVYKEMPADGNMYAPDGGALYKKALEEFDKMCSMLEKKV